MSYLLSDFQIIRPCFESKQKQIISWFQKTMQNHSGKASAALLTKEIEKYSCQPPAIQTRGHMVEDFCHNEWDKMDIYNVKKEKKGAFLSTRMEFFTDYANKIFSQFYCKECKIPADLIHVTCTGYHSPSAAQLIVSKKNWTNTRVFHAYHMGCYAAISAIRIAKGFASLGRNPIDIVHTEISSLHTDPLAKSKEQHIVQSLFADGFIKYSLQKQKEKGLKLIAIDERVIPNSSNSMTWTIKENGFVMHLAKEIPVYIKNNISSFFEDLCREANIKTSKAIKEAIFAIHPGGPKIIDYLQKHFSLSNEQITQSRLILQKYGNMSSATLPHIWNEILQDEKIPKNQLIVSFAFGPGLTICGAIFVKK